MNGHKIRIKLRFDYRVIDQSVNCGYSQRTGARVAGPIPASHRRYR